MTSGAKTKILRNNNISSDQNLQNDLEEFYEVPETLLENEISQKSNSIYNSNISINLETRRNSADITIIKNQNNINNYNSNRNNFNFSYFDNYKYNRENINYFNKKELQFLENFNSNASKNANLINMPISSSCERSKISTIDSLYSKLNCNLKENSDLLNLSKEYSNLKFIDNINERNFILKENIIALRKQLAILNNNNNINNFNKTNGSNKFNFDRIINNENNESFDNNSMTYFEITNQNNNNLNNNYLKKNGSIFRNKNNLKEKSYLENSNFMNINTNYNISQTVSKNFNENEENNEENKLNTIYETCNSPSSNSILDKIIFEDDFTKDIMSFPNENRKIFDNIDSQSPLELEYENKLMILKKNNNEIRTKILNLNLDFNKYKGKNRMIKIKKNKNNKDAHLYNLLELQVIDTENINISNEDKKIKKKPDQILTIKISHDYKYLSVGKSNGDIYIYEFLNLDYFSRNEKTKINDNSFFNLINDNPLIVYKHQKKEIIEICWSYKNLNEFYSASLDNTIFKYSTLSTEPLIKLDHKSMVICMALCPISFNDEERIVSFTANKYLTVWAEECNEIKLSECYLKQEIITSINFSPDGKYLFLGDINGKCYKLLNKIDGSLEFDASFFCRNKYGRYSNGRKINNIEFINNSNALITTCDSRIRLVNIKEGNLVQKFKGHVNFNKYLKAHYDEANNLIISPSEDNNIYIWKINKTWLNNYKNNQYEYFSPFTNDKITNSFFVPENCLEDYISKIFLSFKPFDILSIIINTSEKGKIQILLNHKPNQINKKDTLKKN